MPAYFDCGFSVRQPMWHGEGTVLEDYPADWDEARMAAGLMWEPTPAPVYTLRTLSYGQIEDLNNQGIGYQLADRSEPSGPAAELVARRYQVFVAEADFQAITRDDTGKVLAVPSSGFRAVTHAQMGEVITSVLESDNKVLFETAGSCREGRQVWALAYLDEPYTVPGDDSATYPFLAFQNSHDGSGACKLVATDVRVVCWNTWNAAADQGDRSGAQFVFRHTGNIEARIEDAKEALKAVREGNKATRELFEQLARVPVNDDQVKTFTQLFIASPADRGDFVSTRVAANIDKARAAFGRIYAESPTTDAIRGTAYGLLQSATEYLDHVRGFKSRDSYLGRTLLRPERAKRQALALIGEVTN